MLCCAVVCCAVQGVYGCANPGELQGLMGPSGAGKSTLMDLLSKRTDPTGSAAAEAALQQHTFGERLRTIASRRSTDATGTASNDGAVTSPSAASAGAASAVSSAGLQSRIQPGAPLPHLESELLLNGAPLSRSAFMKLSAYVPQVCCGCWRVGHAGGIVRCGLLG
jgi:ABC-type transport system involved in cytochrome bd biosynthesis fused ATPase/permease subunit